MVYIAPDGTVHEHPPWSVQRFVALFWGLINFFVMFFKTMFDFGPRVNSSNSRGGGWGSGGGGGGGSGGGGGGQGPPKNRRLGRIMQLSDCPAPPGGGGG